MTPAEQSAHADRLAITQVVVPFEDTRQAFDRPSRFDGRSASGAPQFVIHAPEQVKGFRLLALELR